MAPVNGASTDTLEMVLDRNSSSIDQADTPRKAALNTSELLENILVHLPAAKIIACQCVNKTWRDCVARSVSIREKLFLRIRKLEEYWDWSYTTGAWSKLDADGQIINMSAEEYEQEKSSGHPSNTIAVIRSMSPLFAPVETCNDSNNYPYPFVKRSWSIRDGQRRFLACPRLNLTDEGRAAFVHVSRGNLCPTLDSMHLMDRQPGAVRGQVWLQSGQCQISVILEAKAPLSVGDVFKSALNKQVEYRGMMKVLPSSEYGCTNWVRAPWYGKDLTLREAIPLLESETGCKAWVMPATWLTIQGVFLPNDYEVKVVEFAAAAVLSERD